VYRERKMEFFRNLAILAALALMLWLVLRRRYTFVVRIEGGTPRVTKGRVPRRFLDDITAVCRAEALDRGRVYGVIRSRSTTLTFSREIPPPVRQQLRNAWQVRD
jgi:Protein of unknown function (DUF3634)